MAPPPSIAASADDLSMVPARVLRMPVPVVVEGRGPARTAPAVRDGTLKGIAFIVASTFVFSLGDIAAKSMTAELHGLEVTWFRFLVFVLTIPLAVLLIRGPAGLVSRRPKLQVLRALSICGGSTFFIVGLGMMPVAENTAVAFLGPLFITALSIPMLGEQVGVRRWAAAIVGFAGVMLIVRPGSDAFQLAAVFPILAALIGSFGSIFTRQMADEAPETTLAWTAVVSFVLLSAAMPFVWVTPSWEVAGYGVLTGVLSTIGHVFVVLAFRSAPASLLAPFTYVQLLFAGVFAYLAFGDVPGSWTIAGILVIAASGLYTAHRERVRGRT